MKRVAFITAFVLLITTMTSWTASAGEPLEEATARATEFREELGLDSSRSHIEGLARDARASREFGIPLTGAEAAELNRRVAMQQGLNPLKAYLKTRADFGGLYIDQSAGGVVNIILTGESSEADVLQRARELAPGDAPLRIRAGQRSLAELERTLDSIATEMSGRLAGQIASAGIVEDRNAVEVALQAGATISAPDLAAEFGPGVIVVDDPGIALTACIDWNNCAEDPWRGGLSIDNLDTLTKPDCSTAFVMKAPAGGAARKMLTAGHCGSVDSVWQHDDVHFGTMNAPNRYAQNSDADVVLINILDSWAGNQIVLAPVLRNITSQQGFGGDSVGDVICQSGFKTKDVRNSIACGVITSVNIAVNANGVILLKQRRANLEVRRGDSGGSVFIQSQALGVVSAGAEQVGDHFTVTFYSHIAQASDELNGWSVQTTP